jgi:hypothetical protein
MPDVNSLENKPSLFCLIGRRTACYNSHMQSIKTGGDSTLIDCAQGDYLGKEEERSTRSIFPRRYSHSRLPA